MSELNVTTEQLAGRLRQANEAYRLGKPFLTDKQFDQMEERLRLIDPNNPYFSEVGFKISNAEFKHQIPMLSQQKCLTEDELMTFLNFLKNNGWQDLAVSAKLDGMSASVHYKEGKLTHIVSRGDGEIGVDYTKKLSSLVPESLDIPFTGEVRGELVMSWKNFDKLKAICEKNGETEPTHPRNSVVGIISADKSPAAKINLIDFVSWGLIDKNGSRGKDPWHQYDENTWTNDMTFVKELGFKVVSNQAIYYGSVQNKVDVKHIIEDFEKYKERRDEGVYPIDGIIFRIDSNEDFEECGWTSHHPKGAAAFKFVAEEAVVEIKEIEWSVGSTGELTPIAIFKPVKLAGAKVGRASLHNIKFMLDLGLMAGMKATIIRSGEVIPRVIGNPGKFATKEQILFSCIDKCPVCGESLKFSSDYTHTTCVNENCTGKLARRLELFCKALDMDYFGPANCQLIAAILTSIDKLFDLSKEDLRKAGLGYGMSEKVYAEIHNKTSFSLEQFLTALCIPTLGPGTAKELAFAFKTLDRLRLATYATILNKVERLGDKSAGYIYDGLRNASDFIDALLQHISIEAPAEQQSQKYAGLAIAVTGSLTTMSRDAFAKHVQDNGGKFATSVSKNTSILICNQASSSTKAKKAAALGVNVMTEQQFFEEYA